MTGATTMIPDELGWTILIGGFVLAGVLIVAQVRARRAREERLRALGFEPCEDEAPRLLELYRELAGGHGTSRVEDFQIARCFKKRAGTGFVYRFTASDPGARSRNTDDHVRAAPVSDVYLVELGARAKALLRPCSLFLANVGGGLFRGVLAKLIATLDLGQRLELPDERAFLAAFGALPGKLEEYLGAPLQELAARAAQRGFFAAHFGHGRAALLLPDGRRDVDAEVDALADWIGG